MKRKAGPLVAALALAAGMMVLPTPAQAGDTWGLKNCEAEAMTLTYGRIECFLGSWRARAKVTCYNTNGNTVTRYGIYIDSGFSTGTCPAGYEPIELYAQYNQGPIIQLI